ncbi:hypothetical protein RVBP20_3080 [Pseudomonas phage sp. NK1]|nr:hypothetical protein RVBP20_3080 [Pseudomonas phage sp. NK1]
MNNCAFINLRQRLINDKLTYVIHPIVKVYDFTRKTIRQLTDFAILDSYNFPEEISNISVQPTTVDDTNNRYSLIHLEVIEEPDFGPTRLYAIIDREIKDDSNLIETTDDGWYTLDELILVEDDMDEFARLIVQYLRTIPRKPQWLTSTKDV